MVEHPLLNQLTDVFQRIFGATPVRQFFAPGRVNLIGEHTDYNGGYVFPCALDLGTYGVVRPRQDQLVRVYSANFPEAGVIEFPLTELMYIPSHGWANYPKGVIQVLAAQGFPLNSGLELAVLGNLPNGAGLSSSASIEVLMAIIIQALSNYAQLTSSLIAKYCQQAENKFIGVSCGIMDQFAIANGQPNQALLLDCQTLTYQAVPLNLGEYSLVIANSNKRRTLADSKYNERCDECAQALNALQTKLAVASLGELTSLQLHEHRGLIPDPVIFCRARHAVSENERALRAVTALKANDLTTFGQLMNQSHHSLRDDYAVTGHELDSLVAAAQAHPSCIGSRMTGAGFGGCTISLVKSALVADFVAQVSQQYLAQTGLTADFYPVKVGRGAMEIT
jgi:galactokinase